jgi:hypothetical protein
MVETLAEIMENGEYENLSAERKAIS